MKEASYFAEATKDIDIQPELVILTHAAGNSRTNSNPKLTDWGASLRKRKEHDATSKW